MTFDRFTLNLAGRVILIALNLLVLAFLVFQYDLFFTYLLLALVAFGQVVELIRFVHHTNRELHKFLEAVKHEDYSVHFSGNRYGQSFSALSESFDVLIKRLKETRARQQSHAELIHRVLESIQVGIIVMEKAGQVILMNSSARAMLEVPHFHNWSMFQKQKPGFTRQLGDLDFEGRRLIQVGTREFYLDLDHIQLVGHHYHLISFSDLKNEIEQKEIEAWHKLIRILAHEVMNSVTPISSLSETVQQLLTGEDGQAIPLQQLTPESIDDIREALKTIVRRSRGMLSFVEEYRKLTRLPAPRLEVIPVGEAFKDVCQLMRTEADAANVQLDSSVNPPSLALNADRKMLEQVLINLISNSLHALEPMDNGHIHLAASLTDEDLLITVKDNGPGIPEEIVPSIFIPFFSTRKNGTGIGLTLSKNIMKLHQGNISVESQPGKGTLFRLSFNT